MALGPPIFSHLTQDENYIPVHLQTAWDREGWQYWVLEHRELQSVGRKTATINYKISDLRQELSSAPNMRQKN